MSQRRSPSSAPVLEGFEPVELIGSGGYADVFLFQQHMPDRRVAVKVLVGDVVASAAFTAEANLMARVSAHPYIVTIFEARVAADGRPYLVMEYYPGSNFLDRVRAERFSVADALRVGVHVAGAAETAHRAGILHRDIKPANILTSEYGRPGLTDFGIASAEGPGEEAEGVSIPWSPPEAFRSSTVDVRADVYSLAATIYHLLAGRSPFEVPGGKNGSLDLMSRIERDRLAPLARSDVPTSLERLLDQAMAKDPVHRPASAAEFARSLQAVENELRLSTTPLELPDMGRTPRARIDDDDGDATRVRGVTEIEAQPVSPVIGAVPHRELGSDDEVSPDETVARRPERPRQGLLAEPEVENTVVRPVAARGADGDGSASAATSTVPGRTWLIAGVAVVIVAAAVLGFVMFGGGDEAASNTTVEAEEVASPVFVSAVEGLDGVSDGGLVTFSWSLADDGEAGDSFVYGHTIDGSDLVTGRTDERSVVVDAPPGAEVCLDVTVTRDGASNSPTRKACVVA